MAEWTQKEQAQAQEQVIAETRKIGGTYYTTAIDLACQRNLALWALNDVHDFLKSHGYDTTLIDSAIAACTEGK